MPTDAGVVFFANWDLNDRVNSGLGPESVERVAATARLYAEGTIKQVVCVGGNRSDPRLAGSTRMARQLTALGVTPARVHHDTSSYDTVSNWQAAKEILPGLEAERILLISSPLHLLRIRALVDCADRCAYAPSNGAVSMLLERPLDTVKAVHLEWVAWTARALLPADTHARLIRKYRNWTAPALGS